MSASVYKTAYVISAYMKNFKHDMLEVFDTEEEAREVIDNIAQFGQVQPYGIHVTDPVMGVTFDLDKVPLKVLIEISVCDKISESGNFVISSESVDEYWGPYLTDANIPQDDQNCPRINMYVPWQFYMNDINLK